MGIKGLLMHLPGGIMPQKGFSGLNLRGKRVVIDAAGPLHECARNHASSFVDGNFVPALVEFYRILFYFTTILKAVPFIVFDGMS
jgi:hypothetical protein